jgi:hypothetical protein
VETPLVTSEQRVLAAQWTDIDVRPAVVTISVLGVLLTGLCLAAVDRLDRSAPARSLAVVVVVTALVAVVVAIGAQLSALLRPASGRRVGRRSALVVLVAGLLSMLAVLLAGAAALFVIQPGGAATASSADPTIVVQRSGQAGTTTVTAHLSFAGLSAGSVIDATITAVDDEPSQSVVARSAVRVGEDGPAVVQLAASVDPNDDVVIEAKVAGRKCSMSLPSAGSDDGAATKVSCTSG